MSNEMIPDCTLRFRATSVMNGATEDKGSGTKNFTEITGEVLSGTYAGRTLKWRGWWTTEKAQTMAAKACVAAGWDTTGVPSLETGIGGIEFDGQVGIEPAVFEADGTTVKYAARNVIAFINEAGGSVIGQPLNAEQSQSFAGNLRGLMASLKLKPLAKAAPAPATVNGTAPPAAVGASGKQLPI